jgi:hypothetical protein
MGRNLLIDLELDYQVHPIPDEFLRHLHSRRRIVAVIQHQQVHSRLCRCILQARCDRL